MDDERVEKLVTPFYLGMMGLGARDRDDWFLRAVAEVGRTASDQEVVDLLGGTGALPYSIDGDDWRQRVMGAWFAFLHDDPTVGEAVLCSLATSAGYLSAPPLAVAAVTLMRSRAIDALEQYAAAHGPDGFVAAAFACLGVASAKRSPTDEDVATFDGLLAVGERLRAVR